MSRVRFEAALTELAAVTGFELDPARIRLRAQQPALATRFRAAEAAAAALAGAAAAADTIARQRGHRPSDIAVAGRHAEASLLSFAHLAFNDPARAPDARLAPEQRTAAAGFHATSDNRVVYLHPGFAHNTAGLLRLLNAPDDPIAVAAAVASRSAQSLENDIAAAGLCGAMVRTPEEWDTSRAGRLLGTRPVVDIVQVGESPPEPFTIDRQRPLAGVRVLDLTRILAGPTCARTLAAFGATALRVAGPNLPSVPLFVADTGFGKRSCHLDLHNASDRGQLTRLIGQADVFSQGYRTGAMDRLGYGVMDVAAARPGIVYVSINCYGHEDTGGDVAGIWRTRPGWEQLAQTVTGMAHVHGADTPGGGPALVPAAVNDYTTGYLGALGALVAIARRARIGGSYWVRVSLARTAVWVRDLGLRRTNAAAPLTDREAVAMSAAMATAWGPVRYLRPAVSLSECPPRWDVPPAPLGAHPASFG